MKKGIDNEIIIFCQAPADVQYTLDIYDKNKHRAKVSIFCINVKASYKFLKSLNLVLKKLIFIPYSLKFGPRNPLSIYNEKIRLAKLYKKYFDTIAENDIYFFSHLYDWVLYTFLGKIYRRNKIFFIDHYGYISGEYFKTKLSIKLMTQIIIYKYITGVILDYYSHNDQNILAFPIDQYNVKLLPVPIGLHKVWAKYRFNMSIDKKSILLFENGIGDSNQIINYEQSLTAILKHFQTANVKVYIKPHPRLGYTKGFKRNVHIIPNYVPGEFLPIEKFIGIYGIASAAIGNLANSKNNVFSLIDCFDFIKKVDKDFHKRYLDKLSNNKISYVKNIDGLNIF